MPKKIDAIKDAFLKVVMDINYIKYLIEELQIKMSKKLSFKERNDFNHIISYTQDLSGTIITSYIRKPDILIPEFIECTDCKSSMKYINPLSTELIWYRCENCNKISGITKTYHERI